MCSCESRNVPQRTCLSLMAAGTSTSDWKTGRCMFPKKHCGARAFRPQRKRVSSAEENIFLRSAFSAAPQCFFNGFQAAGNQLFPSFGNRAARKGREAAQRPSGSVRAARPPGHCHECRGAVAGHAVPAFLARRLGGTFFLRPLLFARPVRRARGEKTVFCLWLSAKSPTFAPHFGTLVRRASVSERCSRGLSHGVIGNTTGFGSVIIGSSPVGTTRTGGSPPVRKGDAPRTCLCFQGLVAQLVRATDS